MTRLGMNRFDAPRVTYFRLGVWHQDQDEAQVWHGLIETAAEQCLYFDSLAGLNRLLCELGGWMDPPLRLNQQAGHEEGGATISG